MIDSRPRLALTSTLTSTRTWTWTWAWRGAACCLLLVVANNEWSTLWAIDPTRLRGFSPLCSIWLVVTHVADGLHGLMDLTWGRVARPRTSTLLPPHRTAPRNASGTFLGASSVCTSAHRSTTPQCTIPVTTPHSTSLLHHYYKHITATATNTHLPHLAMLMMPVMSSTPTCSDLLIHYPSPRHRLGD